MRTALLLLCALTAPLRAQRATAATDARRILSALADDSMMGRGTGTIGARRAATFIAGEMKRVGLEPLGDSGFFQRVPVPQGPAVNVLGVLRGADPALAREHILIDAHYDHLGIGPAVRGDSIYNGADDDGSGVTAVLEIARQFAEGPRPKRTVVFAATIGEEVGLLGTEWYIAHPAIPLAELVANMEIEMIGRPDSLAGGPGRAWLTGYERSTMGDALAGNGVPIVPDKRPQFHFFERSDNIAFAMRGIVAHTLSSYNLHGDYHTPFDDISRVDFTHMASVINAAAKAARLLSDGPPPAWKPGGRP